MAPQITNTNYNFFFDSNYKKKKKTKRGRQITSNLNANNGSNYITIYVGKKENGLVYVYCTFESKICRRIGTSNVPIIEQLLRIKYYTLRLILHHWLYRGLLNIRKHEICFLRRSILDSIGTKTRTLKNYFLISFLKKKVIHS